MRATSTGTIDEPSTGAGARAEADGALALIAACHGRMRRQLDTLLRLARHLPAHGHDEDAQAAARTLLRYFDTAGALHHQDEESSLLPRVRERAPEAATLDARLRKEHRALALRWRELRPLLSGIAAAQRAALPPKLALDFGERYRAHMAIEEEALFPLAARVLDADATAAIGREMAARRV
jgi:iron-sulfur cluster repair protein YtfE (RIC family)